MTTTRDLTREAVEAAINESATDVIDAMGWYSEKTVDAINLVVNATLHRLFTNPDAEICDVIEACYETPVDEVLGWLE